MSAAYCLFVAALAGPAPELPASRPFSEISTARAAVTQAPRPDGDGPARRLAV
jgi:hypothetical protein